MRVEEKKKEARALADAPQHGHGWLWTPITSSHLLSSHYTTKGVLILLLAGLQLAGDDVNAPAQS